MNKKKYLGIIVLVVVSSFAGFSLSFGLSSFTKAENAQSGSTQAPKPGPDGPVCPIE